MFSFEQFPTESPPFWPEKPEKRISIDWEEVGSHEEERGRKGIL